MKDIWEPLSVDWRTSVTNNVVVLLALLDHGSKYSVLINQDRHSSTAFCTALGTINYSEF